MSAGGEEKGHQVIPEAAVEAAAERIWLNSEPAKRTGDAWAALSELQRALRRARARHILEAAAPHMLAGAKAEALEEASEGLAWLGAQGNTVEPNTAWAGVCACIEILRDRAASYRPTP